MKTKLTTVALYVGLAMGLGPWVLLETPSSGWVWVSIFGGVLVSIAGYDAKASMVGMDEPGEKLLQGWWKWVKAKANKLLERQNSDRKP
jgi:hypothetical protein